MCGGMRRHKASSTFLGFQEMRARLSGISRVGSDQGPFKELHFGGVLCATGPVLPAILMASIQEIPVRQSPKAGALAPDVAWFQKRHCWNSPLTFAGGLLKVTRSRPPELRPW